MVFWATRKLLESRAVMPTGRSIAVSLKDASDPNGSILRLSPSFQKSVLEIEPLAEQALVIVQIHPT